MMRGLACPRCDEPSVDRVAEAVAFCLCACQTVGRITGDILVNGRPKEQSTWARVCGYVEQMDIHIPHCTVYEALTFSAHLRLESTTSKV